MGTPLDQAAQDTIVTQWIHSEDRDGLVAAVTDALGQRHVQLAARLVGLLNPEEGDPPELERARRAAGLLLVEGGPDAAARAQDLAASWTLARERLVLRGRRRQRERLGAPPHPRHGRGRPR